MTGFSGFKQIIKTGDKKTLRNTLLPSEHKDTEITGGSNEEEIIDIKDRIEFIKEDIFNQDGEATNEQKYDIYLLNQELKKLLKK